MKFKFFVYSSLISSKWLNFNKGLATLSSFSSSICIKTDDSDVDGDYLEAIATQATQCLLLCTQLSYSQFSCSGLE